MGSQINVAVLGTGFMGAEHAKAWASLKGVQVRAYSPSGNQFREGGNITGSQDAYPLSRIQVSSSLCDTLNLPAGSIVDICLPTSEHLPAIRSALEAGAHILCEKPLARNIEIAEQILELCRAHPTLRVMPAHCIRFWPAYEYLADVCKKGNLGSLESVSFKRQGAMPTAKHFADGAKSGGALFDLMIHDIDFANAIIGNLSNTRFSAVGQRGRSGAWDQAQILVQSQSNVGVLIEGGWKVPKDYPFVMSFEARFEFGVLKFENDVLTLCSNESQPIIVPLSGQTGWERQIAHFLECVRDPQQELRVTVEDACAAVKFACSVEAVLNGNGDATN